TVILVALTLMGMTFINLTSIDFTATDNYVNNTQADMVARAGLEYAVYVLKMDKYGTDSVVYNNNSYRYYGTTTLGYDENYDAYTEEWLGPGRNTIFGSATASNNVVDNNGDGTPDSNWLNVPLSLDRGLKAQYAILIEDIGESRINVNATGNVVGTTGVFIYGTGATTYDIRLQDILTDSITKNVIGTSTGRCGNNGVPGNNGTTASQYNPRNPSGDDRPFNILDAADFCFGTYTSPSIYKSRLRNIINNESIFQTARGNLTPYSSDNIITNNGISGLILPDNNNYYRLKLDSSTLVGSITSQLQATGFSQGTATQLAVHTKDYMDTDNDITAYGTPTKYGLEPHPFINELYYTGTSTGQQHQYLIELYNPFNVSINGSNLSINSSKMDLMLKVRKTHYTLIDEDDCIWTTATITSTLYTIDTNNFSILSKGYTILGYGTQNTVVTLSGTQTVTGFNIYDFDDDLIPQEVTVTLMGSSSALGTGNYLMLDEAAPNAYTNTVGRGGEDILWELYDLIDYINSVADQMDTNAFNSLIAQTGNGVWGPPHTSTKSGDNALTNLVEPNTGSNVVWDPGDDGIEDAIDNMEDAINKVNTFIGNGQIYDPAVGNNIINESLQIIDALNGADCSSNLNVRASIGERNNPILERSTNWGTATTHTLGGTNTSYSSVPTNERKQLSIANNNMISLGEMGRLLTIGYGTQSPYTGNSLYNVIGSSTVDNAMLSLTNNTATLIPEYFTIIDPKSDSIDDDADGAIGTDTGSQVGDIDGVEIQVPGRININTATSTVLSALPGNSTNTSLGTWSALMGNTLINNIINARPYSSIGTITSVSGMNYFATDNKDNDADGFIDEKDERDLIFTSISNLITTHSNVFAVYVTARITNGSATRTFAEKKIVAIVDRSVTPIKIRYFRLMTEW
ncbi:MAG TPA: hypothetical protein ACFYEG_05165, partial [Candidatus Wujingus californicus]|uniref:hypothetical protein n=1 Tax=Candidatus Wujingus californicus TaxID=3367618 RepID=UPI0040265316